MTETITYGLDDALRDCGVTETTLDAHVKDSLDRLGYVVLPDIIDPKWLSRMRTAFEAADVPAQRNGQFVVFPPEEMAFDGVYTQPRILAAGRHVIGRPFRAIPVNGRAPAQGHGLQALHADWMRAASDPFHVVTTLWLLDDFTPDNGATRVVPGSHRLWRGLPKGMQQPESRHPDQKLILARAGSVLVMNAHLWHSGTRNHSGKPRRVLQYKLMARDQFPPEFELPAVPDRFPPAVRFLLGE